jgi:hypothetical protein
VNTPPARPHRGRLQTAETRYKARVSTLRATSRGARSRNRSESWMDSQCGIDAMWRDRCDACFAFCR